MLAEPDAPPDHRSRQGVGGTSTFHRRRAGTAKQAIGVHPKENSVSGRDRAIRQGNATGHQ
jgi:hypothetical protein